MLFMSLLFCQITVISAEIDSLLLKHYEYGRYHIKCIIEEHNMDNRLYKRPFYAYIWGGIWMFVVKETKGITLYSQCAGRIRKKYFPNGKKMWKKPFYILDDYDLSCVLREDDNEYHPFMGYFVLCDAEHNVLFEWDYNTKSNECGNRIWKKFNYCLSYPFWYVLFQHKLIR